MSFIVIIPARFSSTRLPGKPLLNIGDKTMIEHVVHRAKLSSAEQVIVATDDERIQSALAKVNCEVCMTSAKHQSGSDRLAEVVELNHIEDSKVIVNVQGDEPFISPALIDQVATALIQRANIPMATVASPIERFEDIQNPNIVKVVINQKKEAMYFSRCPIPYIREQKESVYQNVYWRHIGMYAYRAEFLKRYQHLQKSQLEELECLEQLRVLDNGEQIIVETCNDIQSIGIDTEQDLMAARDFYIKLT